MADLEGFSPGVDGVVRRHATANPDVAGAIMDEADRLNADLIVIPSHGHSTVGAMLMGSVSSAIVRLSDRPVLVLKPQP